MSSSAVRESVQMPQFPLATVSAAGTLATWQHEFRQQLCEAMEQGTPSLEAMARQMAVSRRTLQRRLAEHGTTWRAELDAVRQRHAERTEKTSMTRLARQLGYADPRSVRRAMRRWNG